MRRVSTRWFSSTRRWGYIASDSTGLWTMTSLAHSHHQIHSFCQAFEQIYRNPPIIFTAWTFYPINAQYFCHGFRVFTFDSFCDFFCPHFVDQFYLGWMQKCCFWYVPSVLTGAFDCAIHGAKFRYRFWICRFSDMVNGFEVRLSFEIKTRENRNCLKKREWNFYAKQHVHLRIDENQALYNNVLKIDGCDLDQRDFAVWCGWGESMYGKVESKRNELM